MSRKKIYLYWFLVRDVWWKYVESVDVVITSSKYKLGLTKVDEYTRALLATRLSSASESSLRFFS